MIARIDPVVLGQANLRGGEYAWPRAVIPDVIEAVRVSELLNVGGQLQFRFPEGTCECYWVVVDVPKILEPGLARHEQIEKSAQIARAEFDALVKATDFLSEGTNAFSSVFKAQEAAGFHPRDFMCFVWYASDTMNISARGSPPTPKS